MLSRRVPLVVGLRREDPTRIWERRTPLTPDAVRKLVSERNVRVQVEHCDRRVFRDHEYVEAGAKVVSSLHETHIQLGIKETPLAEVITSPLDSMPRTHLMFSHTAKGQTYNTPLLDKYISGNYPQPSSNLPRLIDYEYLTDEDGKRTVGFGWFAGVAGVLESLSSMAHSHLEFGVASPFLYTPRPHTLPSLESLRVSLRGIGNRIAQEGTPSKLGPFIIGLTGTGNVTNGCLSILEELPLQPVSVKDLGTLVSQSEPDLRKIYLVHAKPSDYLRSLSGQPYDRANYYQNPTDYRSTFATDIAPYLTLFLNGVGWAPSYPRLMSNGDLTAALSRAQAIGGARFTNIGDISCDPEGGLQFLTRSSTLSEPFYKTRPDTLPKDLPSVQMMAVDILPAAIPYDASQHFSRALAPYLDSLIDHYQTGAPLGPALERATIASEGRLAEKHEWLWAENLSPHRQAASLAGPTQQTGAGLKKETRALARKWYGRWARGLDSRKEERYRAGHCRRFDGSDALGEDGDKLGELVSTTDVVISLLPATVHAEVAKSCIQHRKHLVTASYISPAMKELHDSALDADVLLLNEIGLDPGIDHCSAISLVSRLQAQGKTIKSFTSFCGGLPAPDVPKVPLRYKFSWSPRGVLTAATNPAQYVLRSKLTKIPGSDLLRGYLPSVPAAKEFGLEGIPNRDSLSYLGTYNLGKIDAENGIRTMLRGTLRYPGFSRLLESFRVLGFLETGYKVEVAEWQSLLETGLKARGISPSGIRSVIPDDEDHHNLLDALEWLSLVPSKKYATKLPPQSLLKAPQTPLDLFTHLLSFKLAYLPGERDMVVLAHEVIASTPGKPGSEEVHRSSLVAYGDERETAMARTVGLPVVIAAMNMLDGKVSVRGVVGPTDRSVYVPVLEGLEEFGLGMKESVVDNSESIERVLAL
ncbi:hypothetical protein MKEN_00911300 [Mycena kentingensis (nom. inval.)]|nr:hypothetical protein MKEN_00911300 [Mycena kentingensis (nom. inval.)]